MSLPLRCDCGKQMRVRDELAGKKLKCPGCGNVLVAPLETETPPAKPKKPASTALTVPPPLPRSVGKKKSPPPLQLDDEEGDEEVNVGKPARYWLFPGRFSTEMMVVAHEGFLFVSLSGDALKKTKKMLKLGNPPENVIGRKASLIPWEIVKSIYCNRKLRGFTIYYHVGNNQVKKKALTPADNDVRDEIMDHIADFLKPGWQETITTHSPITATFLPLGSIAVTILVTAGMAYFAHWIQEDIAVQHRQGRVPTVHVVAKLLYDLGPLWVGVIGFLVAVGMLVWLLVRIISPPIDVRIARRDTQSR